jgi:uncharacterized protein with PIN domain
MTVFREICSPAPRSRSEIVLRLTPSLRAKSAWDISARRRPWATWTGETKTEAVTQAFRERLQCTRRARTKRRLADDLFIAKAQVSLVPVDEEQADLARRAFRKYGKGRHPAGLNFGDCFSYALSKAAEGPLLFKGNDFLQTDIECHPASTAGEA